jgi:hypothetical protein
MARRLVFVSWPPRSPSSNLPSSLLPKPLFRRQQSPTYFKFSPLFQTEDSLPSSQEPVSTMPFMILVLLTMNICFLSVQSASCRFPHVQLSATVCSYMLSSSQYPETPRRFKTRGRAMTCLKETPNTFRSLTGNCISADVVLRNIFRLLLSNYQFTSF